MADKTLYTCADHDVPLLPRPGEPGILTCPAPDCGCTFRVRPAPPGPAPEPLMMAQQLGMAAPLTSLEQAAAAHHEFVTTYVAAGFTRAEAMQMVCAAIQAMALKGMTGSG